ncbi:MAG: hypothetical protein ABEK29_04530, partial [Bradymonadaceae bacterium]
MVGCTADGAQCTSDTDCVGDAVCVSGGGVFVRGGVCVHPDTSPRRDVSVDTRPGGDTVDRDLDTAGPERDIDDGRDLASPDGCTPDPERCNGGDDDCDGDVDEPTPCDKPGVCQDVRRKCVDGTYQSCADAAGSSYESDESSFDGSDNDCNGATDEIVRDIETTETGFGCVLTVDGDIDCWRLHREVEEFPDEFPIRGDYDEIALGHRHLCALSSSGTIDCWGQNSSGQADPPSGTFSTIDGGWFGTCGVSATDGLVDCWGTVPDPGDPTPSTDVSVGYSACGLDMGGALACWGQGYSVETGVPEGEFSSLDVEQEFGCAVEKGSGIARCWGGGSSDAADPVDSSEGGLAQVAVGEDDFEGSPHQYACGIQSEGGTLTCWGQSEADDPSPPSGSGYRDVTAVRGGGCAVTAGRE